MEHTAGFRRGNLCVQYIIAVFLNVNRVLHPLIVLGHGQRTGGVVVNHTSNTIVVLCHIDGTRNLGNGFVIRCMFGSSCHVKASITLIGRAVGRSHYGLCNFPATRRVRGAIFHNIRSLRHGFHQFIVHIKVYLLDGLGGQAGMNLDRQHIVLGHFQGSRTNIDRCFLFRAREWAHGILGSIGLHILLNPGHGRTLSTAPVNTGIVFPCSAKDIAPQGDTSAIGGFPHHRQNSLVLFLLLLVVGHVYIQFCNKHGHLQFGLLSIQRSLQVVRAYVSYSVRLVTIGINRCSGITQRTYQINIVVNIILDGVVVVVNQDSIRPALVGHIKGLDQPVVACLTATTQGFLHHRITLLVHTHCLVHHINHRQGIVMFLSVVKPIGESSKAIAWRQAL